MSPPNTGYRSEGVLAVILGGGRGRRLSPLTRERCKPAVPIGGRYRLIDIPVSNCINSGLTHIFVLTQFNSVSLHRHLNETYKMDVFNRGFVEILAAQQTEVDMSWFEGTADAVRKCRRHLDTADVDRILILSGDQLYRMDFRDMISAHRQAGAEATVAAVPVPESRASGLGLLRIDDTGRILQFAEKPRDPAVIASVACEPALLEAGGIRPGNRTHLASMGIYLFEKSVLFELLDQEHMVDFGGEVFPHAIAKRNVHAHLFDGYWRDIGTIRSFYDANLAMADWRPEFNLYEPGAQIFTHPRFLPPAKVNSATIERSIIAEGSIVDDARIDHSIIGLRTVVRGGVAIRDSIIMGADHYDWDSPQRREVPAGAPLLGVGPNTRIRGAIVDKNARIGPGCVIENVRNVKNEEGDNYVISEGIVVIPRGAVLPPGTII